MHEARRKSWDANTHGSWRARVRMGENHTLKKTGLAWQLRHICGLFGLQTKSGNGPTSGLQKKMVLGLGPLAPNK